MLRQIQDDDYEVEAPQQRDVELTLGPALLLAIACGLLLLCGLCFGVGYTAGRRNGARLAASKEAATGQTLDAQAVASGHKPTATGAPLKTVTVRAAKAVAHARRKMVGRVRSPRMPAPTPLEPPARSR